MTEEIWRPVVGYEGLYEVSSYGRVRSLDRYVKSKSESYRLIKGKVLIGSISRCGYIMCHIRVNEVSKYYLVHRLVAEAFIPNPDNLSCINHKNEDKTDNRVENLEWCSYSYNNTYGTRKERFRNTMLERGHWTGLSREEYCKKWYQENKDKRREYNQENKEKKRDYNKKYNQENKEKIRDYHHQYYLKKKAGL